MNRLRIAALVAVAIQLSVPTVAHADSRVIVKYRKGAPSKKRRSSIEAIGGALLGAIRGQGTKLVAVAGDPIEAARRLAHTPGVAWAEPDYKLFALDTPNDPLLAQLGGLGLIHAQSAWDALGLSDSYPSGGGAPVAIVDTGVDATHEDLAGKVGACASAHNGAITEGTAQTTKVTARTLPAR